MLDAAQAQYLKLLKASPAAIRYLKQRGLTGEIAAHFGLGWSGTDRHGLSQVFPNYDDPALVEAGLVIESEDGRRYDRFRERVMFPIRNARGSLIGFGGRIIGKGRAQVSEFARDAAVLQGQELYGLWEARQAIRQEGQVIVVEGYMDVVGLAQQGIANAVATLGTATTPDHVKKLLRASDKVIFSFDGDGAGRRAAWRALQACLPVLRDDIAIRFLFLPAEHDPDSYVRELGAEAFRPAWAKPSPCRDSCWTSWPRATTWTRPKGGRAVCTRPSRCWPRSRNARCASRSSARWPVGPAHAGRNGPGAGAAAGQTIRRAGGCQGAAGRRRPDRILGIGYGLRGWGL